MNAVDVEIVEKCGLTLFKEGYRHKALYGGRVSGKSWSCATYLPIKAFEANRRILCCRHFQNSIRDSSKELVQRRIHELGMADACRETNTGIVNTSTGSEWLFYGLERNIDSIRSLEGVDIVWVEEGHVLSQKSLDVLIPTIRKKDAEFLWCWNPQQPSDPVDEMFRGKKGPPPNSIVTRVDWTDNKFIEDNNALLAEMEQLKLSNLARFDHVYGGEYDVGFGSRVFPNVRIGRLEIPAGAMAMYGMDLGHSADPTVIVKLYAAGRQLYVAAELYVYKAAIEDLPELVLSMVRDRGDAIVVDSSRPETIHYLQTKGFGAVASRKGANSVRDDIMFLQGFEIVIDPNCERIAREFHEYSWRTDRRTGMVIPHQNPIGVNDHGIDAVRYGCQDLLHNPPLVEGDDPDGGVMLFDLWPRKSDRRSRFPRSPEEAAGLKF